MSAYHVNHNQSQDGLGFYTKAIYQQLQQQFFTSLTNAISRLERVYSLKRDGRVPVIFSICSLRPEASVFSFELKTRNPSACHVTEKLDCLSVRVETLVFINVK